MQVRVANDPATGITILTPTGEPSFEDYEAWVRDGAATPATGPVADVLWDLREMDVASIPTSELRRLISLNLQLHKSGGGRTAFLVDRDVAYGVMRILEARSENVERSYRVFRDRDGALTWLNEGKSAGVRGGGRGGLREG